MIIIYTFAILFPQHKTSIVINVAQLLGYLYNSVNELFIICCSLKSLPTKIKLHIKWNKIVSWKMVPRMYKSMCDIYATAI